MSYGKPTKCDKCDATIPGHKWGHIKEGEAWFFSKTGKVYCPDHIPDWVESWRKK